jgi:hypothetical protein
MATTKMGIPRFQRHLNELSGVARRALHKDGEPRHYVYRFRNPLFQPSVKMTGRAKDLISDDLDRDLQASQISESAPTLFEPSDSGPPF